MRILVIADGPALGVIVAALLDGGIDVGLIVACVAALIDALPLGGGVRRENNSQFGG